MRYYHMKQIQIGNKQYQVEEAITEEQKQQGLQNKESLNENEGMLFYYDNPETVSFTMKSVKFPIDMIFIDEDQVVKLVITEEVGSTKTITVQDVSYVLEVNANSGIKKGDELEFEEEAPVMKVLAPDGSDQMSLWGGERIVSRRETKILISKAKKAEVVKTDPKKYEQKCKSLGKYIFKVFNRQDNREPEYVQK